MEDRQIIDLFWERSEEAITETAAKYESYCRYIATRILPREKDAESIVNDTWFKAWNTIPPQRPASLKAYVGMICRQLAINAYEVEHAKKRGGHLSDTVAELEDCIPDRGDMAEAVVLRDLLNRFLSTLPKKTRCLFIKRYWYAIPITEIAADHAMSETAVTALLCRTRKKLKHFLEKEGVSV